MKEVGIVIGVIFACALIFALCVSAFALEPSHETHDSTEKVDEEFRKLYLQAASKNWDVLASTPAPNTQLYAPIVVQSNGAINVCMGVVVGSQTLTYCVEFSSK